jgi:hypothetical protein
VNAAEDALIPSFNGGHRTLLKWSVFVQFKVALN